MRFMQYIEVVVCRICMFLYIVKKQLTTGGGKVHNLPNTLQLISLLHISCTPEVEKVSFI